MLVFPGTGGIQPTWREFRVVEDHPLAQGLVAAMVPGGAFAMTGRQFFPQTPSSATLISNELEYGAGSLSSLVEPGLNSSTLSVVARVRLPSDPAAYPAVGISFFASSSDNFALGFGWDDTANGMVPIARSDNSGYGGTAYTHTPPLEEHLCITVNGWGASSANFYRSAASTPTQTFTPAGTYASDTRKNLSLGSGLLVGAYMFVYNRVITREEDRLLRAAPFVFLEEPSIWVPVSAGGGGGTTTATTSLSAAIQQANALTAGLSAAVQTTPTASASLQAAVQASRSAQAQLDAAVQQARSATTALDVAVQAAATPITTSLAAAVQLARSATAALDLAVQAQGSQTTSLSAQVQAAQQLSTSLSAQVQAGSSVSVAIAAAVLQQAVAAAGVDLAVQAPGAQTAALGAALQVARNAAAALDLALSQARTVAASVSLQIQDGVSALASIDVAVQQARNAVTGVQLAIRQSSMASASLDAVLMLQRAVSATLNTAVAAPRSISTIINLYILTNASGIGVSELVTGATVLDRNLVARLVDALVIGRPFNRLS